MSRKIVKRSDRAKAMAAKWNSTEPYRDGLTYRDWMRAHAKAQRATELEALRTPEGRAAADTAVDADALRRAIEPPAPPAAKDEAVGDTQTPAIEEPSVTTRAPAEKKTTWGLRRWRAR